MNVYVCTNEYNDLMNAVFTTENKAIAWARDQLIEDLDLDDEEDRNTFEQIITANYKDIISWAAANGYVVREIEMDMDNKQVEKQCCKYNERHTFDDEDLIGHINCDELFDFDVYTHEVDAECTPKQQETKQLNRFTFNKL